MFHNAHKVLCVARLSTLILKMYLSKMLKPLKESFMSFKKIILAR